MSDLEEILRSKLKPKDKQTRLVESVCSGAIDGETFIESLKCIGT